jgi:hypothetical protein
MSAGKISVAILAALAICGCSQKSPGAGSPQSASQAGPSTGSATTTIPIPANKDLSIKISLPPGTHKVGLMNGAAAFSCRTLQIMTQSGGVSNNFTDAEVPAKLNMTDGAAPGDSYVSVSIDCRGGAADTQLVITPAP